MNTELALLRAAEKIARIYSSDDGVCLKPDPSFNEQQIIQAWINLRAALNLVDDLK